ncbi:hypothetical protein RISK_006289 [Rhodopirellula islandica]|uniref:Uncharacterized protein n=1 Tax=Rhodopirellula islandica TaxID=595434 RepID=A0A0J1B4L2_RHOIS|nr:hypothetical protein RISK_006289 [Rhodopirellula islandica]
MFTTPVQSQREWSRSFFATWIGLDQVNRSLHVARIKPLR